VLHVYHHGITALLCFWGLHYNVVTQWIAPVFNSFVHIPMYAYYLGSILGWQNMWWKIYITQIQILQFFVGLIFGSTSFVLNYVFMMKCRSFDVWYHNMLGLLVTLSFLFFFIKFYATTYTKKNK